MTSIGPYSQSHNFTHMFNIRDIRGCLPKKELCCNSISGFIQNNPNLSIFNKMLEKSNLQSIYNDNQANLTLFVPSDLALKDLDKNIFKNMNNLTARNIIKASTLDRRIPSELLEDSPSAYFNTKNPYNRIFISNMNEKTYINNCINIIQKDIETNNGIIHIVDGLIWPIQL